MVRDTSCVCSFGNNKASVPVHCSPWFLSHFQRRLFRIIELNNSGNTEMSLAGAFVYIYFIAAGMLAAFRTSTDLTYPFLHAVASSLVPLSLSRLRFAVPRLSLCHDVVLDLSNISWFDQNPARSTYQCKSVSKV